MMARSPRFARPCAWFMIVPLLPLALFTGCRSSSRRNDDGGGGGGGGCCRGAKPLDPLAAPVQSSSASVNRSIMPPANHADSVAANTSPSTSPPVQGLYGGQKTCPVTGHDLGSMGAPIPVTVKGQTIYVCCQGCVAKLQRDPDTFLRKVETERSQPQSMSSPSNSSSRSGSGGCCGGGGGGCCCHRSPSAF